MKNWSGIFDLLNPDNTMTFNRLIAHSIGAVETIIYFALISKCRYWEINNQLVDGEWFYSTTYDLQESTTFSEYQQKKAINKLEKLDLIRCTTKGIPAKRCFVINDDLNLLYSIIEDGRKISEQLHEKALEKNHQKSAQRKLKSELSKNPEKRSSEVFLDKSVSVINTSLTSVSQNSVESSSEKNAEQVLGHNLFIFPQINCGKSSSKETSEQVPKKIEHQLQSNCRTSPAVSQGHTYNLNKNNLNENNLSYPINQSKDNFKDLSNSSEKETIDKIDMDRYTKYKANIADFRRTAAKYDIQYALSKCPDKSAYYVMFSSSKAQNIEKAFREYASGKVRNSDKQLFSRESQKQFREKAAELSKQNQLSGQQRTQKKEKVIER